MPVQTSDQQTTEQQLTTIDRYCSSVICHLEFLHDTFQQLSKLLCLHIIISTQKSLYLRFYHCLWQLLNCISIIFKKSWKVCNATTSCRSVTTGLKLFCLIFLSFVLNLNVGTLLTSSSTTKRACPGVEPGTSRENHATGPTGQVMWKL